MPLVDGSLVSGEITAFGYAFFSSAIVRSQKNVRASRKQIPRTKIEANFFFTVRWKAFLMFLAEC
jgi:hypothetical protein